MRPRPPAGGDVLQPCSILILRGGRGSRVPYLSKSSPPVTSSSTNAISEGVSKISFSLICKGQPWVSAAAAPLGGHRRQAPKTPFAPRSGEILPEPQISEIRCVQRGLWGCNRFFFGVGTGPQPAHFPPCLFICLNSIFFLLVKLFGGASLT